MLDESDRDVAKQVDEDTNFFVDYHERIGFAIQATKTLSAMFKGVKQDEVVTPLMAAKRGMEARVPNAILRSFISF